MQHDDIDLTHNPACLAAHLGLWMVEPRALESALAQLQAGTWRPEPQQAAATREGDRKYDAGPGGVAVVALQGALMKGQTKFGTSTLEARRALRQAVRDEDVRSILLLVDSPGGQAAGTHQLFEDVRAAARSKPVHAHVDDLSASAAVFAMAGASRVTANAPARIGSIGAYAVVTDTSAAAELEGVKVHVVSSGGVKGHADGAPVSEEQLVEVQREVDHHNNFFVRAVAEGRGLSDAQVREMNTGQMFSAREALALGLIDEIQSFDDTLRDLMAVPTRSIARARTELRRHELDMVAS